MRHLLVNSLLEIIPEGKSWPPEEQAKWLKAAKEIFALVYSGTGTVSLPLISQPPQSPRTTIRPPGTLIPTPEHGAAALVALPEMLAQAPDGVTIRMIQDRFKMEYGLARAVLLRLGELPEYTIVTKPGSNTLGLFPKDAAPAEDLSENQKALLDALTKWKGQKVGGWIGAPLREIAKIAGVSMGSAPSVIEALDRKQRIEVDRRGGDGVNRYKVVVA